MLDTGWQFTAADWQRAETAEFFPTRNLFWQNLGITDSYELKPGLVNTADIDINKFRPLVWENQGWAVTRMMMNFERSSISCFARMKRLMEQLLQYCKETSWNGKSLASKETTQRRLADMAIEIEVGYALSHRVAWTQHKMNYGQARLEELVALASGAHPLWTPYSSSIS